MKKTIIANVMPEETRMAVVENGRLAEVSIERSENGHIAGNIYKGKIKNILPGMQAAFIDIGLDKNAFLHLSDMSPNPLGKREAGRAVTVGQDMIVQIAKESIGTKGPRVTPNITLPGRYVVLMPVKEYIGISRRIGCETERERLRRITEQVKPTGMGVIVRTVAEGKQESEIARDIRELLNYWQILTARAKRSPAPLLLYRDADLVIRIVRDYLSPDVTEVIIDNREAYSRICDILSESSPELLPFIRLYEGSEEIFSYYGIAEEIDGIGNRSVSLKCGGTIVIDTPKL